MAREVRGGNRVFSLGLRKEKQGNYHKLVSMNKTTLRNSWFARFITLVLIF